jgi:hypothetical protein
MKYGGGLALLFRPFERCLESRNLSALLLEQETSQAPFLKVTASFRKLSEYSTKGKGHRFLAGDYGSPDGRKTEIPGILVIPAVTGSKQQPEISERCIAVTVLFRTPIALRIQESDEAPFLGNAYTRTIFRISP